jgi:hypothetical protein
MDALRTGNGKPEARRAMRRGWRGKSQFDSPPSLVASTDPRVAVLLARCAP